MDDIWPVCCCCRVNHLKKAFTGQRSMGALVIEATELKFEVRFGLQGHLEATMASEASLEAVRGNIHIGTRAIEVVDFKSEVR